MTYNWQQKDWPHFTYQLQSVEDELLLFAQKTGRSSGILQTLPEDARLEAIIDTLVAEAVKTSEIEGEYLSRKDVRSSIRNNLGLNKKAEPVGDKRAAGVSELMTDVRRSFGETLTQEKLFTWHRMLLKGRDDITIGAWRTHEDPMQIVSGASGKQRVHYEAPPSSRVPGEMDRFISWYNNTAPGGKNDIKRSPVRAAIAHLYFESIHPFEDGNGRIGRALAEIALSQGLGQPILLSLSKTIDSDKDAYYLKLERASLSNEITPWIQYFVKTVLQAQTESEQQIVFTLKKTKLFDRFKGELNDRQMTVVRRMLEEGPKGFQGGMNARKYVSLTKTSKATATRDLQDMVSKGVLSLMGEAGGRSTSYQVNL